MSFGRNSLPAIVTALLTLAFGLFGSTLVTWVGYLAVPSAVGLPYGLPGLRVSPVGETSWLLLLADVGAALVLIAVLAATRHGFWAAWGAFVLGSVLAGMVRAAVSATVAEAGAGAYWGFVAGGLVAGLLWGIALGWAAGLAALPRRRAVLAVQDERRLPTGINSMG
ncbi:hypothetical protein [Nonomuraea typhae]|uniref:DUF4345 domain-containing protein n=1 Tax=Nonomuraea typhae TaxID=2603600 RepID=A0ABW7YZ69_9ACTN